MERRTFFKNLFGATMVAVIPKPIFETIVALPKPLPAPTGVTLDLVSSSPYIKDGVWIFEKLGHNKYKFISFSSQVNLEITQNRINITSLDSGEYVYLPAPQQFSFSIQNLEPMISIHEFQMEKTYIVALVQGDVKVYGECFLTQISISESRARLSDFRIESAEFRGSGELTYIQNDRENQNTKLSKS